MMKNKCLRSDNKENGELSAINCGLLRISVKIEDNKYMTTCFNRPSKSSQDLMNTKAVLILCLVGTLVYCA
jgi:hypothetical protein